MSYENPRIELTDSLMSMMMKMVDGNPGAINVLMRTIKEGPSIDPDCAFGEMGAILSLDTLDVYGSDIWILYKDVCGNDLTLMLALIRSVHLGIMPEHELKRAIEDGHSMSNERKDEILSAVKVALPAFGQDKQEA